MKLSNFFQDKKLVRDSDIELTHFANQSMDGIVCFVLNEGFIEQANKNSCVKAIITYEKFQNLVHEDKGLVLSDNPKKDSYEFYNTNVSAIKKAALKIRSGLFPQRANLEIFSIFHRGEEYSIDFRKIQCAVLWINSEFGLGSYDYSVREIINSGNSDVKFFLIKGYSHVDMVYGGKAREDVWNLIT